MKSVSAMLVLSVEKRLSGNLDADGAAHRECETEDAAPDASAGLVVGVERRSITKRAVAAGEVMQLARDRGLYGNAETRGDHPDLDAPFSVRENADHAADDDFLDRPFDQPLDAARSGRQPERDDAFEDRKHADAGLDPHEPAGRAEAEVVAKIEARTRRERELGRAGRRELRPLLEIETELRLVRAEGKAEGTLPQVGRSRFPGKAEVEEEVPVEAPLDRNVTAAPAADQIERGKAEAGAETVLRARRAGYVAELAPLDAAELLDRRTAKREAVVVLIVQDEGALLDDAFQREARADQPRVVFDDLGVDGFRVCIRIDQTVEQFVCIGRRLVGEEVVGDLRGEHQVVRDKQPEELKKTVRRLA